MPTSYTPLLGLALPVTGELSGTWGDTVNNYITQYIDSAVDGTQTISGTQTAVTLSVTTNASLSQAGSGATGSAQYAIINCTGAPASLLTITAPASSRQYIVINATSTSQSVKIVGAGPTTGVTLVSGEKAIVAWNGSDFVKVATSVADGVTSVSGTGTVQGLTLSGTVTSTGSLTLGGSLSAVSLTTQVSGTLPVANGGTGQTTYTDGQLLIGNTTGNTLTKSTLTAGSGVTITNGNGSITIAATGSGGTVTGVTATSPVASSGGTAPVISLNSAYGDTLNPYASKTANFVLAAPNGAAGVPTFRAIVAADIPTLNQNTTGTASNVTGTVAVLNGGTGATTAATARTNLGSTTVGDSFFTLTNPSAITFPRINANNTVSALDAATFRSAIGAGTGSGSVTSVSGTGTVNGITLSGTVTSTGSLTLGGTLSGVSLTTQVSGTLPVGNGGTGATTLTGVVIGNGASAFTVKTNPSGAFVGDTDTQTLTNKTLTSPEITQNVQLVSTNTTAVRSRTYVLTASLVLTLPATPTAGDTVTFINRSNTTTASIARNGSNIMSLAEDMTLDSTQARGTLVFADATRGWTLID